MALEPHQQEDPASSGKKQQKHNSLGKTAENLTPPFFILLFAFLAFYIFFSPSSSPQPSPIESTSFPVIPDSNTIIMSSAEQT